MNEEKYFVVWYKTTNSDTWQYHRLYHSYKECEKICKQEGYAEYDIVDYTKYDGFELHMLTDAIYFEEEYYFTDERIPYPSSQPQIIKEFEISLLLEDDYKNDDSMFEEVYENKGIDWGWGQLWTEISTKFIFPDKTFKLAIVAQNVINDFPSFLENLKQKQQAVYSNLEYDNFKWLAWLKNNKVRLIHQSYDFEGIDTVFDILVDKDYFFNKFNEFVNQMREFADEDIRCYEEWKRKNLLV